MNAILLVAKLLEHDVAELCGPESDPNNLPLDAQRHFKQKRYWHKPRQGFKYDGHEKIYPPDEHSDGTAAPVPAPPKARKLLKQTDLPLNY